jgi:iron complex transport system ATP-binding protein
LLSATCTGIWAWHTVLPNSQAQALMTEPLTCKQLTVAIAGRTLLQDLDLSLPAGSITCVLGLNGSGKTLTLHTLAGLRPPHSGSVKLFGEALEQLSRRQIAGNLGLLLQTHEDAFPITVLEAVLMGQHAKLGFWEQDGPATRLQAEQLLSNVGLAGFANRQVNSLSGGERRRTAIATIQLQDPSIWLLDEPTNHLDPQHQLAVMEMLSQLAGAGKTVIASIHDPLLAARYSNYALLLHGNGHWQFGAADQLLTPDHMRDLYGVPYENLTGQRFESLVPA